MEDLTPKWNFIAFKDSVFLDEEGFGERLGGLGGRTVNDVEDAVNKVDNSINSDYDFIKDVINDRLDTAAETILGDFEFGPTGALQIGKYVEGTSGDIRISRNGIIARDDTGSNTVTIDGTTGNITLIGTITATEGYVGGWTISAAALYYNGATDDVSSGMASEDYPFYAGKKYADRATSPFRVTPAGILTAVGANISGNITISGGSGISNLSDSGSLATEDTVGASDCDTTIISGGKIITGLLTASNIQTGTLDADLVTVSNLVVGDIKDAGDLASKDEVGASDCNTTIISGGKIITGLLTASNIRTGTLDANKVTVSNLDADNITAGTLTGRTVRTQDPSGGNDSIMLQAGGTRGDFLRIFYGGTETGYIGNMTSSTIQIKTLGTGKAVIIGNSSDGIGLTIFGNSVASKTLRPASDNSEYLGTSSYGWKGIYLTDSINSYIARGSTGKMFFGSSGIYVADELIPNSNNIYDLGSSSYGWDNVYLNDIYNGSTWLMDFNESNGIQLKNKPLRLYMRSSTPGTASSSYEGYMYYDKGQDDIVFCAYQSGTSSYKWFKVSATEV